MASFDRFYRKDWETYKWTMPTTRFFGYYRFLINYYKNSNRSIEDIKREKVESVDWDNEVKELKRKLKYGRRKNQNSN